MATLTGFKVVGDSSSSGASDQQQQSTNGHQNPVFVFEEVDVGDGTDSLKGNNDEADVFVDANSVNIADATAASADNHPTIKTMSNTASTTTTTNATAPVVPVESMTNGQGTIDQQQRQPSSPTMTNSSSSSGTVVQQTANNSTTPVTQTTNNESDQHQQDLTRKAANQTVSQQQQQQKSVTPPSKSKQQHSAIAIDMPISAAMMPVSAPSTPMGTRKNKGGSSKNNSNNNSHHQHSLSPNANNDPSQADSMSVSMLSIGTGKSPRTPRRSPLMALFRGKPRESVRKMYTDEDQFEIEWANVCLELQEKWYQKYSVSQLTSLLCGGGGSDSSNKNSNASNVDTKSQRNKLILNTVNGRIRSGEITAILGPSGAGKTSLLHSLFGKHRTAIQGSIKVTGAPTKKHLTVCTIPQSDYLIGYLTTQEALWFASRLKNTEDDFNHDKNIERVIELLGLQRCRDTRINKLSGGQYKRVSIAQEMLSSPDILVLDEPTSGLDSLTCYRTVKVLRDLVEASKAHNLVNPMSIVLTIHQPHREVLDLFHSIYIMAVGGQCLYQGTPNEMENTINHYSGVNMPQTGYNPASFMVEIASEEYGREPIQKLVDFAQKRFHSTSKHDYSASRSTTPIMAPNNNNNNRSGKQISNSTDSLAKLSYTNKKGDSQVQLYPLSKTGNNSSSTATLALSTDQYVDIDLSSGNTLQVASATKSEIDSRVKTPRSGKNSDGVFWTHVSLMAKRAFLSNLRDPLLCTIRVGAHIFIPLVVALIYGPKMGIPNGCPFYKPEIDLLEYASMGVDEIEAKHDDIRIQFQNVGLHFMVYYAFGLCMLAFTAISFPLIMHVLIKEIRNGWYSLSTFILGKMLAELPAALILPPISVGIIYVLTGQPSSYLQWRYMVQSLLLVLIIMIAEAKGLIFGAICMNSMQTAVFSASVSTVPFILLSGFLIRIREVPYVLQRLSFLSYFKHSVEALIITRYGFGMCPCNPDLIPPGGTPVITGIPVQIMSLTDYYINQYSSSVDSSKPEGLDNGDDTTLETNIVGNNRNVSKILDSITTLSPEIDSIESRSNNNIMKNSTETPQQESTETTTLGPDGPKGQGKFFNKLAQLLTRANAFGFQIKTCDDVEPFTMKDMHLSNDKLAPLVGYLFIYIVVLKFISYFIVEICVKLKL